MEGEWFDVATNYLETLVTRTHVCGCGEEFVAIENVYK